MNVDLADMQLVLDHVVQDTFATMAFLFPDDSEQHPPPEGECLTAVVEFTGPFCGELRLTVSSAMPALLAANMLGLEPPCCPSLEQELDALGELLNVICGNLLPAISSPREEFHVHKPRVLPKSPQDAPDVSARSQMWLDGGFAGVSLMLHGAPAPAAGRTAGGPSI